NLPALTARGQENLWLVTERGEGERAKAKSKAGKRRIIGRPPFLPSYRPFLESFVQRFLEIAFLAQTDKLLRDLPILEQDDGRDGANGELHRNITIGVGIDLAHLDLAFVVLGDFLDGRREHPAGHAPLGPEVHENRLSAF